MTRRLALWALILALPTLHPLPVAAHLAAGTVRRPALRCRGSTRAHVAIAWPTRADEQRERGWGKHLAAGIRRWAYLFVPDARASGVDPYLVAGIMRVESNGDPLVWNLDSDARGLMQVLHASFQPAVNIGQGVSMLGSLQRQFGTRDLVLAAYNAGPGNVEAYHGIPPFPETQDYVVLVDYYRDLYSGLHLSAARVTRFRAALANLRAFVRRVCGT